MGGVQLSHLDVLTLMTDTLVYHTNRQLGSPQPSRVGGGHTPDADVSSISTGAGLRRATGRLLCRHV